MRALALRQGLGSYVQVLKPRETALITFIGASAGVIAASGHPPWERLGMAALAIALGSAGVNGLTNYLDREVDARMQRTRRRPLASGRIYPPERVLPFVGGLTALGLLLAWLLHPLSFLVGFTGTIAALLGRKTPYTHFLGGISGMAPVGVGWLALDPSLSPTLLFLCLLVLVWVPLHVWSLMLSHSPDYRQAGVCYFPVGWPPRPAAGVLLGLSLLLYALSWWGFGLGAFGRLYLVTANLLGALLVLACLRLGLQGGGREAWQLYKLATFPYLGLMFLVMVLDGAG